MGFYVFRHKHLPNLFWLCYTSRIASTKVEASCFCSEGLAPTDVGPLKYAKRRHTLLKQIASAQNRTQVEDGKTQLVCGTSASLHLRPVPGEADLCHPKPR